MNGTGLISDGARSAGDSLRPAWVAAWFAVLTAVLAVVLVYLDDDIFPGEMAGHIARNSEAYGLALLLALWLLVAGYARRGSPARWPAALAVAAGLVALAALVHAWTALPVRVRTHQETFLSAAFLLPYLALRRPLSVRVPLAVSGAASAVMLFLGWTVVGRDLAETLMAVAVLPITLDVAPRARRAFAVAWYAFLVVFPIVVQLLDERGTSAIVFYLNRTTEAFVAALLLAVFGRLARPVPAAEPARA